MEPKNQTDTEMLLEDIFVKRPEMLLRGLTLVGRQTTTDVGYPDLLGVDGNGRLVVFELKRGALTRDAVAQVLDYGSYLETLTNDDLITLITSQSGGEGIEDFKDGEAFEEWYNEHKSDSLDNLRPVRMVLVGLGVDDRASRIVKLLQNGIDISLLTFHGFSHDGATILARYVEAEFDNRRQPHSRRSNDTRNPANYEALSRSLDDRARELGIADFWKGATEALHTQDDMYPKKSGLTYRSLRPLAMPELVGGKTVRASHSVGLDPRARVRVTFFPAAIELCLEQFEEAKKTVPFESEIPPNALTTERAQEQWYCLLDEQEWATHKATLAQLATDVAGAWAERRRRNYQE